MPKYEMTSETITVDGHVLHRIRALRNIGIKDRGTGAVRIFYANANDRGGYIESEANLSQEGECWVSDGAMVYGDAYICGCSLITDDAVVHGNVIVDCSWVNNFADIHDGTIRNKVLAEGKFVPLEEGENNPGLEEGSWTASVVDDVHDPYLLATLDEILGPGAYELLHHVDGTRNKSGRPSSAIAFWAAMGDLLARVDQKGGA